MADSSAAPAACLYIHVPFCARKCAYCAFYSEPSRGDLADRYVAALVREMEMVAANAPATPFRTVFFGGGTPSLLNLRQWERLLGAMDRLHFLGPGEWTVECNPATVSLDKARLLRAHGVSRLSLGVQSLDEALLERLGRIHTRDMVFRSFDHLRRAGFDNLNLDLMFAIPGQSLETWRRTLIEALALGSEHLSCYEVIYEEDTPLFTQLRAGKITEDEDLACAMYEELQAHAAAAGFCQYEVANFARDVPRMKGVVDCWKAGALGAHGSSTTTLQFSIPAFACRHNINYWRGGSFYGLGPSATSYMRGVRTKNWSNTAFYCEKLEQGEHAIESSEELPPLARAGETAAFGLRMVTGWPFAEFRRVTGFDLRNEWAGEMRQLAELGWGRIAPDRFQLTSQGLRFADAAAELFLR